jgi:hypothetical protein
LPSAVDDWDLIGEEQRAIHSFPEEWDRQLVSEHSASTTMLHANL